MRSKLMTGTVVSTVALAILGGGGAHAQAAPAMPADSADDQQRNKVTVTATRTEKDVDEVPATVSVITDQKIEDELVTDIKDLVRFEPGVSVRSSPQRFGAALGSTGRDGNSGFNIRGLEGDRVLIQTDGVRVADGFSFGPQAQGRGDYVDLDLVKSVEILRGPASALYGSDGVAGVVSFITRDPDDLVRDGRSFAVRARSAFASADESWANSLIGATKHGDWSAMVGYTHRSGQEQKNQGELIVPDARRTAPNPLDFDSSSWLGKLVWKPGDNQRFRLTYDQLSRSMDADLLSGRAQLPANGGAPLTATSVLDLDAADSVRRERFAFDHQIEFGDGFFRKAQWTIYSQASKTRQFTFENRNTAADRIRDNAFNNKVAGASGQMDGGFDAIGAKHHWLLGADYSTTKQTGIRTGTVPPVGETFPSRPFPNTDYDLAGVFLQDEISFLDGQLVIYPAIRYDAYELTPERDALYPAALPATASNDSHVSPKLGLVVWPVDWLGAFVNYAQGYKAPAPSQVNNGFANPIQNYTSISSPDLRPESSTSIEAGVRTRHISWGGGEWSASATAFAAEYRDFIEQVLIGGSFTALDPGIFQYVNLTSVDVTGIEGKVEGVWDNGFAFAATASFADGDQDNAGAISPLQSIEPFKFVAGLSYRDPAGRFGGQLAATYSDQKDVKDVATGSTTTLFLPPDFFVIDLTAYWNLTDSIALRAGIFNVNDETYWWWGDVRGLAASSATRDAYTQPGRNTSVSLTYRY